MMLFLQTCILVALFAAVVLLAVRKGPMGMIYCYPKAVQDRVVELGLTTAEKIRKSALRFKLGGCAVYLAAIFLVIRIWNGVTNFGTAFWQALFFFQCINWFDGLVIDCLWVSHSKFWDIPGTEDLKGQYTDIRKHLKKRVVTTVVYTAVAAAVAGLAALSA